MTTKRNLSQSSTTPAHPRPSKRPRPAPSSPSLIPSSSSQPEPSTLVSQPPLPASSAPTPAKPRPQPPKKRSHHPGTLRRLTVAHPPTPSSALAAGPRSGRGGLRPKQTLAGDKVGGKAKDLKDGADREEMWVKRPRGGVSQGLGFAGYLKKGVGAFMDRGCTSLTVHGMGAAIPLALSLALAIRDAIPGGEPLSLSPTSEDEAGGAEDDVVRMEVRTGSKVVHDEVTPEDEDDDIIYQTRTKSTVSVELSLAEPLASSLGQGAKGARERGGASGRGRKRRGGKR
ncbi:hypothetical protein JCM10207_001978 [Rhodosporidiobolus poonsookiae]